MLSIKKYKISLYYIFVIFVQPFSKFRPLCGGVEEQRNVAVGACACGTRSRSNICRDRLAHMKHLEKKKPNTRVDTYILKVSDCFIEKPRFPSVVPAINGTTSCRIGAVPTDVVFGANRIAVLRWLFFARSTMSFVRETISREPHDRILDHITRIQHTRTHWSSQWIRKRICIRL